MNNLLGVRVNPSSGARANALLLASPPSIHTVPWVCIHDAINARNLGVAQFCFVVSGEPELDHEFQTVGQSFELGHPSLSFLDSPATRVSHWCRAGVLTAFLLLFLFTGTRPSRNRRAPNGGRPRDATDGCASQLPNSELVGSTRGGPRGSPELRFGCRLFGSDLVW